MDADRSRTNVRVVPDLGNELLIVIDRLEALLGSLGVWEIGTTSGYPAPSPTGEDAPNARAEVGDGARPYLRQRLRGLASSRGLPGIDGGAGERRGGSGICRTHRSWPIRRQHRCQDCANMIQIG